MAITNVGAGTQSCTVTTEHSLNTETVFGIYQCYWNLTNSVKSDVFRVFVKTKVLTGDTEEIIFQGVYSNDLSASPIVCSPPFVSEFSCSMHIEQEAGTSRNVPWAMFRLDS
jgi:hypothetical protein